MKLTTAELTIIHTATTGAAAVSASPIPFSDSALLIPIQTTMIVGLYKANGYNISQGVVTGALKSILFQGLVKLPPGIYLSFFLVDVTLQVVR